MITKTTKKIQCEDCLKFFPERDIEELVVTQEKICKSCYEIRNSLHQLDDPYPFP
ncbi:MAG: hypothetical protein KAU62_03940 [Candidatus Heimdallarchaeota archaeon]|nr:hypothetical protein [Candidatus Heimdallarchaeota archaeon]MCK4610288.1 hypothetical protein [Candidatus Heimdallarchaeota archaeon]